MEGAPQICCWAVGAFLPVLSPQLRFLSAPLRRVLSSPEGALLRNEIRMCPGAGSAEITRLALHPTRALLGGNSGAAPGRAFCVRALCPQYFLETSSWTFEVAIFTLTLRTRKARLGKTKKLAPRKDSWNPVCLPQSLAICTDSGCGWGDLRKLWP